MSSTDSLKENKDYNKHPRTLGITPLKKLGQNFLINQSIINEFLEKADLNQKDIILEIGSGTGNLTEKIAKKVKTVIAVEKDPTLVKILKENLKRKNIKNVKIIQDDIQKIFNSNFLIFNYKKYKIVANLPFYLTAPLIRQFLELLKNCPETMTLIIQKELAQRICALPSKIIKKEKFKKKGLSKMNLLAASIQFYAQVKIINYISKKFFWPQPKVDSAIIKIIPHQKIFYQHLLNNLNFREKFFKIIRSGFSHPRKQLANNLSKMLKLNKDQVKNWLFKNNVYPQQRAEELEIKDWISLSSTFFF